LTDSLTDSRKKARDEKRGPQSVKSAAAFFKQHDGAIREAAQQASKSLGG